MSIDNVNERIAALSPEKRELLMEKLKKKQSQESQTLHEKITLRCDPTGRHEPFPLSEVQKVYWLGQSGLFDTSSSGSNIYMEYEITGVNSITKGIIHKRLEKAILRVVDKHDMLKTVILPYCRQQILKEVPPFYIKIIDLRSYDDIEVKKELEDTRNRMRNIKDEINKWPLFEFLLHHIKGNRMMLHIRISALLVDGRSREVLMNEIMRFVLNPKYSASLIECNYRDFVLSMEEFKKSRTYNNTKQYRQKQVTEISHGPILPLKGYINPDTLSNYKIYDITLFNKAEWEKLKCLAAKAGLSTSSVLLSAFVDTIAYWSTSTKFSIGIINTYHPNIHPHIDDVIGNFNTAEVVEADINIGSFIERAKHLQQQILYNVDNPHFSGIEVIRELNRIHGGGSKVAVPIFYNNVINYRDENIESNEAILEDKKQLDKYNSLNKCITKVLTKIQKIMPKFLLQELNIYPNQIQLIPTIYMEQNGEIVCKWQTMEDVFPENMMKTIAEAYKKLLKHLLNCEKSWDQDWQNLMQAIIDKNKYGIAQVEKHKITLNKLLKEQVARNSEKVAIETEKLNITYNQLYRYSNRITNYLIHKDIKSGDNVIIDIAKGWEYIATIIAVINIGASYIAVDMSKINSKAKLDIRAVITNNINGSNTEIFKEMGIIYIDSQVICNDDEIGDIKLQTGNIVYTINESNEIKDTISYVSIIDAIQCINSRFGMNSRDRLLSLYPVTSKMWLYDIFGMLLAGGTIILSDNLLEKNTQYITENLVQLLQRYEVTILNSTPLILESQMNLIQNKLKTRKCMLRLILLSNDRIPYGLSMKIKELNQDIRVVHLWGTKQSPIWSLFKELSKDDYKINSLEFYRLSDAQNIYVLNEAMLECPKWVLGNIHIESDDLLQDSKQKMINTGYMGRYTNEGKIEVFGAEIDFRNTIKGYYINLNEIETELEKNSDIRVATVRVEGCSNYNRHMVAYILNSHENRLNIESIKSSLLNTLPYYAIPTEYVLTQFLPVTEEWILDKSNFFEMPINITDSEYYSLGSTAIQKQLIDIWEEILNIKLINNDTNFFEVGGDSVKLLLLMERISTDLGKNILARDLLIEPTINYIAKLLYI